MVNIFEIPMVKKWLSSMEKLFVILVDQESEHWMILRNILMASEALLLWECGFFSLDKIIIKRW